MKLTAKSEIQKLLSGGDVPRLWTFAGAEDYLKNQFAQLVLSHFVTEEMRDTDYAEYDANFFDASELAEHLSFFPFVGNFRVAYLKGFAPAAQSAEQLDALLDTVTSLPESAVLVITLSAAKADGESEGRKSPAKLLSACEKNGVLVTPQALKETDIAAFLQRRAAEWNASLDRDTALLIAQRCDNDLLRLSNEIEKLAGAAAGGAISAALVEQMIPVELEEAVFRITDNVFAGRGALAMKQLTAMLSGNEDPFRVWGSLMYSFTELSKASAAVRSGATPAQAADAYGGYAGKKSFIIEKNMRTAQNLRRDYPQECLKLMLDGDYALKTAAGIRPEHLILRTFARICALKRKS